ncbi:hypothetical protein HY251_02075, partial [bacterium]|nr:hypothetical protein [bacterium]
ELLVQAPFSPAEGLITLRREGIVSTQRFSMDGPSTPVKVAIVEAHTPNVHVQIDLVGAAVRTTDAGVPDPKLSPRPAFAVGAIDLPVPPLARTLALKATPRDAALEPGGETTIDVSLRDAMGKAVAGGEVAVIVVDESVLALSGYRLPDPLATFYSTRGPGTQDYHLRAHVVLSNPEDVTTRADEKNDAAQGAGFGAGGALRGEAKDGAAPAPPGAPKPATAERARKGGDKELGEAGGSTPIKMRSDFAALATFAAELPTDSSGAAQIKVKLPDTLTRYRVMAVAVSGGREFGSSEATIVARLPLMVRPSPPRFLNFGDRFELPVVIQNQTNEPMDVDVAVRASNATITAGAGRRVRVAGNDRVEVRFPSAAARAGTAHFQIGAASGKWADAAEVSLPVWTPATTEAFATYGELDEGSILQPVKMPGEVVREFGGLEVTTSSTQLQALTDAVIYLTSYPFECAEQLSSRIIAVAALKDVLAAFDAAGLPKPDEMKQAVSRDLARLQGMQNDSGGFGFWHRGEREWPYLGIHVGHALARAKAKGFDVPKLMLDRSHNYLKTIEQHIPPDYGPECRRSLQCYALYVRNLLGDADVKKGRGIIKESGGVEKMPLESLGWLLNVLSSSSNKDSIEEIDLIRRHFGNRVSEEAGTAHFTTSYGEQSYVLLHSDRRVDGVILEALIGDEPKNDLIPKIVRGLLAHRTAGRWGNTQENAFVLLALDRYFQTYEKETPDFVGRMWLGDRFAGEHAWKGRSTDRSHVSIPMAYLASGDPTKNLALSKEGTGRLYYRIGMRYAPASLQLEPSEHGFTVTRSYEAIEKPDDVRRDADGAWHVKAGAKVRVRISMVATARRYHVALVDPLPAGLEAMNAGLAVTGPVPGDRAETKGYGWWWRWTWYEHQNLRDERAEAFTSLLWEGVHSYTYVARATTPGTFVVPPAKAEEMYSPETFGRSASDKLSVE